VCSPLVGTDRSTMGTSPRGSDEQPPRGTAGPRGAAQTPAPTDTN